MTKTLRTLAAVAVAALTLLAFTGAASAQTYSGNVIGTDTTPQPGSEQTVTGSGFPPNSTVVVTLNGEVLGETLTNAAGNFSFTYRVPTACGTYTLTAASGSVANSTTITVPCSGAAAPVRAGTGSLPYTGSDSTWPIAQTGAALVVAGALVTLFVRKRQHAGSNA